MKHIWLNVKSVSKHSFYVIVWVGVFVLFSFLSATKLSSNFNCVWYMQEVCTSYLVQMPIAEFYAK